MKKLIVANWKLHPKTLPAAERLLRSLAPAARRSRAEVVFCPPVAYLAMLKARFPKLAFGAQDAFYADEGPYTGAVGPEEMKSVGARFVIAGHSERRARFSESDAIVAKKVKAILAEKLTPILCVGEPLSVRRKGMAAARRFVADQLKKDLPRSPLPTAHSPVIAYEPVWAISTSGSGKKDTPEDAVEMIRFIKDRHPRRRVLYGGSVNAKNIAGFLAYKEIDGVLVGHASLKAGEFKKIIEAADHAG